MKTYVASFLEEFRYDDRDRAVLLSLCDAIEANPVALAEWESLCRVDQEDPHCDLNPLRKRAGELSTLLRVHSYTLQLLFFISLSEKLRQRYAEQGIPDSVFHDSMCDLRYKTEECREVYGICGSFVASWFIGYLIRLIGGPIERIVIMCAASVLCLTAARTPNREKKAKNSQIASCNQGKAQV